MLDLFGIVFSSTIMLLVIVRAIQLDLTQPWFSPKHTTPDSSGLRLRPNSVANQARAQAAQRDRTRSL